MVSDWWWKDGGLFRRYRFSSVYQRLAEETKKGGDCFNAVYAETTDRATI